MPAPASKYRQTEGWKVAITAVLAERGGLQ